MCNFSYPTFNKQEPYQFTYYVNPHTINLLSDVNFTKLEQLAKIAVNIAQMSKDPKKKVGALIIRPDYTIASVGYNGMPKKIIESSIRWNNDEIKQLLVVHAEANAIFNSKDPSLEGYYLICTHYPCPKCASAIIQSNIKYVFYLEDSRVDYPYNLTGELFDEVSILHRKITLQQ